MKIRFLAPCLLLVSTALAQQQVQVPERSSLAGITGLSPEQPVPAVAIEVRRFADQIATWDFWRGAPLGQLQVAKGRSDAQGRFSFQLPFGPLYDIYFKKPGFQDGRVVTGAGRPFLGRMQAGQSGAKPKEAALGPACLIATFKDAKSGEAVPGVRVRAPWGTRLLGISDAEGRVAVGTLDKVREDVLMAFSDKYRVLVIPKEDLAAVGEPAKERSYELRQGCRVHGRLVDKDGRPQEGIWVVAETDVPVGSDGVYGAVAWWTRTDAEGRYSFGSFLPNGRYWVRSLLNRLLPCELGRGRIDAQGSSVDLGTQSTGPSFAVEGRVTLKGQPLGRPGRVHVLRLSDEKVELKLVARTTPSFPIDPTGLYRIPELAPGSYELCFWVDGLEHQVQVVRSPVKGKRRRLDVDMGPGRTLEGKVVDQDGKPLSGVLLRALVWRDEYQVLVPNGDLSHNGRFLVGNVRVLTREDGSFKLERVRSQVPILLIAMPEGRPKVEMRIEKDGPSQGIVVEIKR
ncbi:MAG: hypothetical protein CSA62_09690 [Planctomycetota bacterium]|nr:MAG: hypothetical protein CSA62_09690 [Planctomycetota bacterium]